MARAAIYCLLLLLSDACRGLLRLFAAACSRCVMLRAAATCFCSPLLADSACRISLLLLLDPVACCYLLLPLLAAAGSTAALVRLQPLALLLLLMLERLRTPLIGAAAFCVKLLPIASSACLFNMPARCFACVVASLLARQIDCLLARWHAGLHAWRMACSLANRVRS